MSGPHVIPYAERAVGDIAIATIDWRLPLPRHLPAGWTRMWGDNAMSYRVITDHSYPLASDWGNTAHIKIVRGIKLPESHSGTTTNTQLEGHYR